MHVFIVLVIQFMFSLKLVHLKKLHFKHSIEKVNAMTMQISLRLNILLL